ncbi:MAG: alanine racemase [Mycoplasmatales bacterium]
MKVVNYQNIQINIQALKEYNQKEIIVVLKNNAYNLGLRNVLKQINEQVKYVMVTEVSDAIMIKQNYPHLFVYLANPLTTKELQTLAHACPTAVFDVMIDDLEFLKENFQYLKTYNLHLKINTSMNRFGVDTLEAAQAIIEYAHEQSKVLIGLCTHFALEDENETLAMAAITKFKNIYEQLVKINEFTIIHAENSYTYLRKYPELEFCNYARLGILVYGYNPTPMKVELKPTIEVVGSVLKIRELTENESFSYGLDNRLAKTQKIAIINLGYGDGLLRDRKDLSVKIQKKSKIATKIIENNYPLIGRISMSHSYVAVDEQVAVGDTVIIYDDEQLVSNHSKVSKVPTSMVMSYLN